MTTEECLLHPNRRGEDGFSKAQLEQELGKLLGISKAMTNLPNTNLTVHTAIDPPVACEI